MKKRWTIKVALRVFAGAVVAWVVAWGCVFLRDPTASDRAFYHRLIIANDRLLVLSGLSAFGRENWTVSHSSRFQTRYAELRKSEDGRKESEKFGPVFAVPREVSGFVDHGPKNWTAFVSVYGFPFGCLRYVSVSVEGASRIDRISAIRNPWSSRRRFLPGSVIPLGFALNTLFYAAVLLGAVEFVAFARRRVRRGMGLCPSCGYDRAGLAEGAACPECGRTA